MSDRARHLRDLHRGYRIERQGEIAYAVAARFTRDAGRRRKWEVLTQLETQMKRRVQEALAEDGETPHDGFVDGALGGVLGWAAAVLPWPVSMRLLRVVTTHAVGVWEAFEHAAPEERRALVAELVAHEKAQEEFARCELARRDDGSLAAVQALLEGPR